MLVGEFESRVMAVEGFRAPFQLIDKSGRNIRADKALGVDYAKIKAARNDWTWSQYVRERLKVLPAGVTAVLAGAKPRGNTKLKNLRL